MSVEKVESLVSRYFYRERLYASKEGKLTKISDATILLLVVCEQRKWKPLTFGRDLILIKLPIQVQVIEVRLN